MAMDKVVSGFKSFLHSVTTNDRYASYESGYRSSPNARGPGSTRSRAPGVDDDETGDADGFTRVGFLHGNESSVSLDATAALAASRHGSSSNLSASASTTSLNRTPYTPGMRSNQLGNGGIPLQDYNDGVPPPPAIALSWKRIDRWVEANYPELFDQLSDEATSADLNELEGDLDCTLPLDVRDSYMLHDGQERGGKPAGVIFGITLLDLEGIAEEWNVWKKTAIRLNEIARRERRSEPAASSAASSSAAPGPAPARNQANPWMNQQESVPPMAIQTVYAHPAWIPLAKDYEGNNIAIDLAPGKRGRWGQVILFGRDFDRKYVVAPSWAHFLSTFADDLEGGDHFVDDDLEEGTLTFRASNGRLVPYFDILKFRVDRTLRQQQPRRATPVKKPDSRPSTPGSDRDGRKISSPQALNLISPVQSTTNLPLPGLSRASTSTDRSDKEPLKETPEEEEPEQTTESESASKDSKPKDSKPKESIVTEEPTVSGESKDKTVDVIDVTEDEGDEVDALNDELTEVAI